MNTVRTVPPTHRVFLTVFLCALSACGGQESESPLCSAELDLDQTWSLISSTVVVNADGSRDLSIDIAHAKDLAPHSVWVADRLLTRDTTAPTGVWRFKGKYTAAVLDRCACLEDGETPTDACSLDVTDTCWPDRGSQEVSVCIDTPPVNGALELSSADGVDDGSGVFVASTEEPMLVKVSGSVAGTASLTTGDAALKTWDGSVCSSTGSTTLDVTLAQEGLAFVSEFCLDAAAGVHLILAEQGAASAELRVSLIDPPEFFPTSVELTSGTTVWLTLPASLTASEPMTHLSCYVVGDSAIQVVDTASGTDVVLTASAVSFAAPTALSVSPGVGAVSGDSARLTCTDGLGQSAFVNFTVE